MYRSSKFAGGFGVVLATGVSLLLLSGEGIRHAHWAPVAKGISSLPRETTARARLAANWGNLPLRFEANVGQSESRSTGFIRIIGREGRDPSNTK